MQLAPTYAKGHFRRGQALRALGEAERAAQAMGEVLKLEPSDAAAALALAELQKALEGAARTGAASATTGTASVTSGIQGAFQPGLAVPSSAPPTGAAAVAPDAASAFASGRAEAQPEKGAGVAAAMAREQTEGAGGARRVVAAADAERAAPAAAGFLAAVAAEAERHAAMQPPKRAPSEAEASLGGMSLPPGFGPDAPGWEPHLEPAGSMAGTTAALAEGVAAVELS